MLEVTRGGSYPWLEKPDSDRAIEDRRLLGLIRDSHEASGGVYGARRVLGDLRPHAIIKIGLTNHGDFIEAHRGNPTP